MLKKIIAASIVLAFIACSSENNNSNSGTPSSPSQGGNSSSSSAEVIEYVLIANLGSQGGLSALFNTYPYGYTLRDSKDEDLTQYWSCPTAAQDTRPDVVACDKRDHDNEMSSILQNYLTTQSSPLHYIINNMITANPLQRCIKLDGYNLTGTGDQAALGMNVSDNDKSIEEMEITALNGIKAFTYNYAGGAHKFRIAVNDADFWYADIPAQEEEGEVRINVKDLKGMGSFAANEDKDETPFDIGKATKFLWVVEYDAAIPANNTGSLLVYLFNALK